MIPELLLLCVCICTMLFAFQKRDRRNSLFGKIPGPSRLPIVGAALELNIQAKDYYKYILNLPHRFGERVLVYLGGFYYVLISNPDDVEKLLTSSVHTDKGSSYRFFRPWLGNGLFLSRGEKWHKRRKMLTSAFHFGILEDFLVIFDDHAQDFLEILRHDFSNGKERDICPYISRCTIDIIGETAMGVKLDTQRSQNTPYLAAVEMACQVTAYRTMRPYFWWDFIFYLTPYGKKYKAALQTLHGYTAKIIRERTEARRPLVRRLSRTFSDEVYWRGKRRQTFLDLLLQAQKEPQNDLTDLDIREEVDTFMFAGHDTSSASINWTIFLLGHHPQYQAKVHEELDRIFGGDKTRPILTNDLVEMKYLEMCIKESLRLFPAGSMFSRLLTSDLFLDKKVTIPAGCDVIVNSLGIHRNPEIYPNPNEYLPDRFLPESTKDRHHFAFVPFSAGPRNCIGKMYAMMEMKVLLANLFRNFKVETLGSIDDVVVMLEVATKPRDGFKIRLQER